MQTYNLNDDAERSPTQKYLPAKEELIKSGDDASMNCTAPMAERLGPSSNLLLSTKVDKYQRLSVALLFVPAVGLFGLIPIVEYVPSILAESAQAEFFVATVVDYLLYLGTVVGAALASPLADRYGRRSVMLGIGVGSAVIAAYGIFSKDQFDVALVVCSTGIFAGAFYPVALIYLTEIVPKTKVGMYCVVFHFAGPVSTLLVVAVLAFVKNWFLVLRVFGAVPASLIILTRWIVDSPSFLMAKGEYKDAGSAANAIASYNAGKEALVEVETEGPGYIKEFAEFERRRASAIFQYPYFWKFESSRDYLSSFSALSFCACFSFFGILKLSSYSSENIGLSFTHTAVYLMVSFILAIYLQGVYKWVKLLSVLFFATGVVGIFSALVLLYTTAIYGMSLFIIGPFSCVCCVCSVLLAATVCPCRVRATGFGIVFACGALGGVLGNVLAASEHELILVFSIGSLLAAGATKRVKRLTVNSEYDDIYEICENRRRFFGSNPIKFNASFDSVCRGSVVKQISTLDLNEDLERREMPTPQSHVPTEPNASERGCFAVFPIEGTRMLDGREVPLGLEVDFLCVAGDGQIQTEGVDGQGKFILEGRIGEGGGITISKRRGDAAELVLVGQRDGTSVVGCWTDAAGRSGEFKVTFKMDEWEGVLRIGEVEQRVEWLIYAQDEQLFGLGETNKQPDMIQGCVGEHGQLDVMLIDGERNELEFQRISWLPSRRNESLQGTIEDSRMLCYTTKQNSSRTNGDMRRSCGRIIRADSEINNNNLATHGYTE